LGLILDPRTLKLTLDARVTQVRWEAEDVASIEGAAAG
jgi:hypothetical protein